MKVLFWGNSHISIPFLEQLYNNSFIEVVAVVTLPDKPRGRGLKILPSPVKIFAEKFNIKTIVSDNIVDEKFLDVIKTLSPELSIVVSYGKLIPKQIISLHKIGMLNVHFSLLPKYRGAAPVQWALINGEKETGITIFWLEEGMDTGDIFVQSRVSISEDDNYYTLMDKLIKLGCKLLNETIMQTVEKKIVKIPQSGIPTYAPTIKKLQAKINWQQPADKIHNIVRAFVHWPKAYTTLQRDNDNTIHLKILETQLCKEQILHDINPFNLEGSIVKIEKDFLIVRCGENTYIKILKLQPENKNVLNIQQFVCGYKIKLYDKFV
ncbi:MAG: methionyl-tRNA formyltransferase [Endomicrobia bacterium]|nr:methionyl-tRNA formyltransferase [Endomicrobiia bacterium]